MTDKESRQQLSSRGRRIDGINLISVEEAAQLSRDGGVPFLDTTWWNLQCTRRKLAYTVVKHRRWVRRDRVEDIIRKLLLEASL